MVDVTVQSLYIKEQTHDCSNELIWNINIVTAENTRATLQSVSMSQSIYFKTCKNKNKPTNIVLVEHPTKTFQCCWVRVCLQCEAVWKAGWAGTTTDTQRLIKEGLDKTQSVCTSSFKTLGMQLKKIFTWFLYYSLWWTVEETELFSDLETTVQYCTRCSLQPGWSRKAMTNGKRFRVIDGFLPKALSFSFNWRKVFFFIYRAVSVKNPAGEKCCCY